jgi:hypothetical protein
VVEAVKLALLEGIPGREKAGVKRLVLVDIGDDGALTFAILNDLNGDTGPAALAPQQLRVAGAMYTDFANTRAHLEALLPGLFAGPHVDCSRARDGLFTGTDMAVAG